jgi:hypothetical protein
VRIASGILPACNSRPNSPIAASGGEHDSDGRREAPCLRAATGYPTLIVLDTGPFTLP